MDTKENNQRDFKGIWIPKEIWLNKDLNITDKIFLVEIDSLDGEKGCYASNDYFADFFDLSKNRCSEIINKLSKKGYINITYIYKPGTKAIEKRIIKVNKERYFGIRKTEEGGIRKTDRGIRKTDRGYSENREDNNININNTINNINKENIKEKKSDEEIIKKIVKIYPGTKTKSVRDKKLPKIIKEHGAEEILEAVTRYAKTVEGKEKQFILNESTFWNGRYIDYLTENYEEEPKVGGASKRVYKVNVEDKSKKEAEKFNNFEARKYSDADYKYLEERCCPAIKEEDYQVKDEDVCFGGFNLNEIENTY